MVKLREMAGVQLDHVPVDLQRLPLHLINPLRPDHHFAAATRRHRHHRKDGEGVPRGFSEYEVVTDASGIPQGIDVIEKLGPAT